MFISANKINILFITAMKCYIIICITTVGYV